MITENIQKAQNNHQIQNTHNQIPTQIIHQATGSLCKLQIIFPSIFNVQIDVPNKWTLNEVKCLLLQMFPNLNFNKFQLQYHNNPLNHQLSGKSIVSGLTSQELKVVQSNLNEQFEKFYKEKVGKALRKYKINTKSTLYPILHPVFSGSISTLASKQRASNYEEGQVPRNQGLNENQGIRLINIIRFFGLIILTNVLFEFASIFQIVVLVVIALIYVIMENYVNDNERRRRQRQRNQRIGQRLNIIRGLQREQVRVREELRQVKQIKQEDKLQKQTKVNLQKTHQQSHQKTESQEQLLIRDKMQENENKFQQLKQQQTEVMDKIDSRHPIKAKVILWAVYLIEVAYCYVLSVFPNWTVETHLHANEQKMNQIMDEVKQLDPQSSEAIKNWRKNEGKRDQKQKKQ